MKRIIFLIVAALIFAGIQFLVNCSNPLEDVNGSSPVPPGPYSVIDTIYVIDTLYDGDTIMIIDTNIVIDTVAVVDTVIVVDTNIVFDTVFINDTVFVIDTTVIIDTLIIVEPGQPNVVCATISSNQQEIVWMFRNEAGLYLLEFDAYLESEHPTQSLTVEINGQEYQWTPVENAEFILEKDLEEQTLIRIIPHKPPSLGHSVYICLKVSRLQD